MGIRRSKLTKEEQKIEDSIEEYVPVSKAEFKETTQALARWRKGSMRPEYGFSKMKGRRNPYARTLKKPVMIRQGKPRKAC